MAIASIAVLTAGPVLATTISLDPAAVALVIGEQVSVDVRVDDLLPDAVGGYSLILAYDASLLSLVSILESAALGAQFSFSDGATPGLLGLSSVSLESVSALAALQGDSILLVSVLFEAVASGNGAIGITDALLSNADGTSSLFVSSLQGATVEISAAVPEPRAALAFAAGLLLVVRAMRGRRRD